MTVPFRSLFAALRLRLFEPPEGLLAIGASFSRQIEIGRIWGCVRRKNETQRTFRCRLCVHLQTVQVAVEDDLAEVLATYGEDHA